MQIGAQINEQETLLSEGGAVYLRREAGGRFLLDLRRVADYKIDVQVIVRGFYVGNGVIDVGQFQLIYSQSLSPNRSRHWL